MRLFSKIIGGIEKACLMGSGVALLAIMLFTNVDVVLRKLSHYAVPSLYEITQDYFMVSLVFLSVSYVYKKGGHVKVTLFLRLVPKAMQFPLKKLLDFMALVYFALITVMSWKAGVSAWEFNEVSSTILAYPLAPALFMVPLGCGLTCLRIALSLFYPIRTEAGDQN